MLIEKKEVLHTIEELRLKWCYSSTHHKIIFGAQSALTTLEKKVKAMRNPRAKSQSGTGPE